METKTTATEPVKFDWYWPDGSKAARGPRLAFDIETNGLLPEVDSMWSLCIRDIDTKEEWSCCPADGFPSLEEGLERLSKASLIVGHNIISYDIPVIKHLYPGWDFEGIARDTLLLAKMIWPMEALKDLDAPRLYRKELENAGVQIRPGQIPGRLMGAQKLEAWGYRMKLQKGEYVEDVLTHGKLLAADPAYEVPEELRPLIVPEAETYGRTKTRLMPWKAWNLPMQRYCEVDVDVTVRLFTLIEEHLTGTAKAAKGVGWSPQCVVLEHETWEHCLKQEARGYGFDMDGAVELASTLKNRQAELHKALREVFGSWWAPVTGVDPRKGSLPARDRSEKSKLPAITSKRVSEKTGKELKPYVGPPLIHYTTDSPFVSFRRVRFNPKSRAHLGKRLQELYGWKPTEFGGKNGDQAKVDETTIKEIADSIIPEDLKQTILEEFVISKTLGQLADGNKAWINLRADDGRLHGRVDPLGTISHRGAHKDPNLGQVPAVSVDEKKDENGKVISKEIVWGWEGGFGAECRGLFEPGVPGWKQTGSDAAGLELRLLGHYLWPYDGGEFARRVSTPGLDIHAENAKITGLSRAETKTVTYAFLYGAGALKLGIGVGIKDEEIEELANSGAARSYLHWLKTKTKLPAPDQKTLALTMRGQEVKKKFLSGITGLKELQEDLKAEAKQYGFIKGLDGRKLYIRKAHAVLNQALQGGGAIVCKMWMIGSAKELEARNIKWGEDYAQMAWVHDECQYEHKPELTDVFPEVSRLAMKAVARELDFRGELDTDTKSGSNWRECH
jgi:DNA polymerase-1